MAQHISIRPAFKQHNDFNDTHFTKLTTLMYSVIRRRKKPRQHQRETSKFFNVFFDYLWFNNELLFFLWIIFAWSGKKTNNLICIYIFTSESNKFLINCQKTKILFLLSLTATHKGTYEHTHRHVTGVDACVLSLSFQWIRNATYFVWRSSFHMP